MNSGGVIFKGFDWYFMAGGVVAGMGLAVIEEDGGLQPFGGAEGGRDGIKFFLDCPCFGETVGVTKIRRGVFLHFLLFPFSVFSL